MTPLGVMVRRSLSSCNKPGGIGRLVTPRTLGLLATILPKQVEKQRLYAMIIEGYSDWKSRTTTGLV